MSTHIQHYNSVDKSKALNKSKPINDSLWSEFKEVDNLVNHIVDEIKSNLKLQRFNKSKYRSNTKVLLLNLFTTHAIHPSKYLAYSRKSDWFKKTRYKSTNVGFDIFISVADALIDLKYVTNYRGYYDSIKGGGKRTRMRAKPKLVKLFESNNITTAMITRDVNEEVIILRKSKHESENKNKKDLVYYTDTSTTIQMRSNLTKINDLLDRTWVDLEVTDKDLTKINEILVNDKDKQPIDFTRRKLKRIFSNSSFEQGGRFYHGWWQEIPSGYRKYITISGNRTEEVDYSGIHIRMMYAKEGVVLDDNYDPYKLEDYKDHRDEVKQALNTIINADTKGKAIYSIKKELTLPKGRAAVDLYNQLEDKHPKIKHYFGTGEGIKLQFIDSQIAEIVMLELIKDDITVLPVHDSFIVRMSHINYLKPIMNQAFEEVVKSRTTIDLKASIREELIKQEQRRPLVKDQQQYPGIREPLSSNDIWNEVQQHQQHYKSYNRREGEWSSASGSAGIL